MPGEHLYIRNRLREQARARPSAPAVIDGAEILSYEDLWQRAAGLASVLYADGVRSGDIVGVGTGRGADFIVAAVAAWLAGAAYLPLDLTQPRERLRGIVSDARPVLVITSAASAGLGASFGLHEIPATRRSTLDFPDVSSRGPAYVIYTSGTTGRPKGVAVGHASLANLVRWHVDEYAVRPGDRALHTASLGFDAAVWEIWPYLAAVVVCSDDDRLTALDIADQLAEHGCTVAFVGTPLAEELLAMDAIPAGLRLLLTGGDLLRLTGAPPAGCTLVNHYGPTEATVVTTAYRVVHHLPGTTPPIGTPIRGARVLLLDGDGREVPEGEAGEISIGGDVLALGYLNEPELTRRRFVELDGRAGRWYRTGDLARASSGCLIFAGRLDREQLKVRGVSVEAAEIEAALMGITGITGATVTTVGHGADCDLVANLTASRKIPVADIRRRLAERLPSGLLPNRYVFGDHLPMTPHGKVDRDRIAALAEAAR